ncbi:MAG: LptE family protein [Candidatus Omnitrophica bacterium]|nr:LptE family protein [Candidatus Omnitrophota bacterium]
MRPTTHNPRPTKWAWQLLVSWVMCLVSCSCGYTTRPGLPSNLRTVYVKPFANRIDFTRLDTGYDRFPLYRHKMEVDLTNAVINRFQFTGLLRPAGADHADTRLEGELVQYRRDPLRYNASQDVEEWRLNLVVDLKFYDQRTNELMWDEPGFTGDTTYFALGSQTESETSALTRATTDLARRIVERAVENW